MLQFSNAAADPAGKTTLFARDKRSPIFSDPSQRVDSQQHLLQLNAIAAAAVGFARKTDFEVMNKISRFKGFELGSAVEGAAAAAEKKVKWKRSYILRK